MKPTPDIVLLLDLPFLLRSERAAIGEAKLHQFRSPWKARNRPASSASSHVANPRGHPRRVNLPGSGSQVTMRGMKSPGAGDRVRSCHQDVLRATTSLIFLVGSPLSRQRLPRPAG